MEILSPKSSTLVLFVNGKKIVDSDVDPEWTLLYYLRTKLRLCGTKLGCGEGGCGSCTVMLSKYDRANGKIVHLPINACLAPICSVHGTAITTVEGIGSTKAKLHPVQERIAESHGTQCGFCTPGMVMSMYVLLRNSPKPSMKELEISFQGNLCRCTGYRPIIEGFKTFTEEWELVQNTSNGSPCQMGNKCCKLIQTPETHNEDLLFQPNEFTPLDPSQEPIFPPELKESDKYDKECIVIEGKSVTWYSPRSLDQLLHLKTIFPDAKIVVGNTEVGVAIKFQNVLYPVIIYPRQIQELTKIETTQEGIRIGASATLDEIQNYLEKEIELQPPHKTRIFKTIVKLLYYFGGKQVRSVGSLGANIMNGSPASDMLPIMMANEVKLELQSKNGGLREVLLDENFFTGYKKTIVKPEEILFAIHIPYCDSDRYCYAYKQSRRREDDITIVNMAINVQFETQTHIIKDLNVAFGGMSFKTVTSPQARLKLKGLPWNYNTLEQAFTYLQDDLPLTPGAPGGMYVYRRSLTLSLFLKSFLAVSRELQKNIPSMVLDNRTLSGADGFETKKFNSAQLFVAESKPQNMVQQPILHFSAYKHATGEAQYCDDMPIVENELHAAFVISSRSHARIVSIDASEALAMEGVCDFISEKDLAKEDNKFAIIEEDEKIFYDDIVTSQGQVVGVLVARDRWLAQRAAKKVKIQYEDLQPVILTISDAITHNSYFENDLLVKSGDLDNAFKNAGHVVEGECSIGGQNHFYLETQSVLVIPKPEDNEMEVFSSCQNPAGMGAILAKTLKVPQNKISVKVKRLGGGFGGKETKCFLIAIPIALAAKKLGKPVRCMLDRDEDFQIVGGRHPVYFKYKLAFDKEGKFLGVHLQIYVNAGHSLDYSGAVIENILHNFENAYYIPSCLVESFICKTNLPSNTAFRGFGGPQAMFMAERMICHIARVLQKDADDIRKCNMYRNGDITYYAQTLSNCNLRECWEECINLSNYYLKRKEVAKFNSDNRYKKRGISLVPTKHGIGYSVPHMNQGAALVLVYTDGSVLLHHGGVEMGQGLHTKMLQVASAALEISMDKIHTVDTSTNTVPNTIPTTASFSSDLNGMAILNACNVIKERLKPYRESHPNGTWEDWVKSAYLDRVSLSATGFHKVPDIGYDRDTQKGQVFHYFTCGVACCEVEIDTLTGDHQIRTVDIVMDLGKSMNPAIDIGQIEGAFIQGYGLFVLEELLYAPNGALLTKGPSTYKIPGLGDIPGQFNVTLLKGTSEPRAIFSSKAVGEPPLFLGCSVFLAIENAIIAARKENGVDSTGFYIDSPATAEKIRMACQDNITSKFEEPERGSYIPWNIKI